MTKEEFIRTVQSCGYGTKTGAKKYVELNPKEDYSMNDLIVLHEGNMHWQGVSGDKQKLMSAAPAQQKLASASEKASRSIAKTGKAAKGARFGIGRMLGMSLLMSIAFRAFSAAINAIKDGFTKGFMQQTLMLHV